MPPRGWRWPPIACNPALAYSFGASADHWRKNLGELGQSCRAFAIDLLGYGFSDKARAVGAHGRVRFRPSWWGVVAVFNAAVAAAGTAHLI